MEGIRRGLGGVPLRPSTCFNFLIKFLVDNCKQARSGVNQHQFDSKYWGRTNLCLIFDFDYVFLQISTRLLSM